MSPNVDDMLSKLPEEVLSHILSLMPTKLAVQTSILTKRWRYIWMFVMNIDFDDDDLVCSFRVRNSFTKFMDLKFSKAHQINLFRLHYSRIPLPKSSVSSWIDAAVRLNVCELDIRVMWLELPLSIFTCKTLTKLRIDHSVDERSVWELQCLVNLPCLKTLDIVNYSFSFANAFKLLRGCPILESLSLEVSFLPWIEEDFIFNIPTLKRLKLTRLDWAFGNNVVLNVPNLEYLFVGGYLASSFIMEDVSSLVEASVLVDRSTYECLCDELLKGLSGVKSLSMKISSTLLVPIFPNMKDLELKSVCHIGLVLQFLENSSELEHLCIEELVGSSWIEPKLAPSCILKKLMTIKFSKCKGKRWDMEFLEYMLGNAEVLKTVTVTWVNLCIEEEKRLREQLLELPRASRYL